MLRRGARRWVGGIVISAAACGVLAWSMRRQVPPLLSRAQFVYDPAKPIPGLNETVEWLSERELIRISNPLFKEKSRWVIDIVDIQTRQSKGEVPLAHLLDTTHAQLPEMSPDGQWICWYVSPGKRHADRLDGSQHFIWPEPQMNIGSHAWSTNGKAWISTFDSNAQPYGHSTKQDRYQFVLPDSKLGGAALAVDSSSPFAKGLCDFKGMTFLPGPIVRCWGRGDTNGSSPHGLTIYDLDPDHGLKCLRQQTIPLPTTSALCDCIMSPDGQSLIFTTIDQKHPWYHLFYQVSPGFEGDSDERMMLWTSRIDGSGLREIGYLNGTRQIIVDHSPNTLELLRWFPKSNRVGIELNKKLYTVDIGK